MKNILILNLGRVDEVITASHFISSFIHEHKDSNIEMLVNKEYTDVAEIVSGVSKIHRVDINRISQIFSTPIYSDAFAINEFTDSIAEIIDKEWNIVFNYCNDSLSSYLASALKTKEIFGTFISTDGVARTSNKWATYQNHVSNILARPVIDTVSLRNHIAGIPTYTNLNRIKINEDYSTVATQNFSRIRQMKGSAATFVVGLNLNEGNDNYAMDIDTYSDVIEAIEESKDYKVVLLLNGKNYQRQLVNDLNQKFNNSLISINVDNVALSSVISNVDAFISTTNYQLAIADAMNTKIIEVRDFSSDKFMPNTIGDGNYVILNKQTSNLASDILLALNEEFGTELPITTLNSVNPVYKTIHDECGMFFSQIRGEINVQSELRYHLERAFTLENMGYPHNTELFSHLRENANQEEMFTFITSLKENLTTTVKLLLSTLRSLKGLKNSETNLNSFITYLDNLMRMGREDSIVGSIVRQFEGRIENIETTDIDSNIKMIESNLFQLKSEIQTVTGIMTELTNKTDKDVDTPKSEVISEL